MVVMADERCSDIVILTVGYQLAGVDCVYGISLLPCPSLPDPALKGRRCYLHGLSTRGGVSEFLDPTTLTRLSKGYKTHFMGCDFVLSVGFTGTAASAALPTWF